MFTGVWRQFGVVPECGPGGLEGPLDAGDLVGRTGADCFFNGQAEGPHGAPDRRHTRGRGGANRCINTRFDQ